MKRIIIAVFAGLMFMSSGASKSFAAVGTVTQSDVYLLQMSLDNAFLSNSYSGTCFGIGQFSMGVVMLGDMAKGPGNSLQVRKALADLAGLRMEGYCFGTTSMPIPDALPPLKVGDKAGLTARGNTAKEIVQYLMKFAPPAPQK